MIENIVFSVMVAFVSLVVRNTLLTRDKLALEQAKVKHKERDDADFDALVDRVIVVEQGVRDTNSRVAMGGLR